MNERGQAYSLEAVVAGLLLISSLIFALQVTAVTPLSASTSNQHIENQHRASAAGALVAAEENVTANDQSALKDALLYWNATGFEFHNSEQRGAYINDYPPNTFGDILDRSFGGRGLVINVRITCAEGCQGADPQPMVNRGAPSDHAGTVTRTVTLYEDDELLDENGDPTGPELQNIEDQFYAPNIDPGSDVYNVVRVEVTVWRM